MTRDVVKRERIRVDEAAGILAVEVKALKKLSALGEIPGAGQFGSLWTYDEARVRAFAKEFNDRRAELIERLKPLRVETLYAVRCGYRVKLGFTRNLAQRLHSLKTANHRTIELLVAWPGSQSDEKALHERFADLRVSGEWFAIRKPIKEWLWAEHKVMYR